MTLIELLVVLAIIALLAGLLFPVFATAKRRAWEADCVAHLKQLGQGFQAYLEDYGEPLGRPLGLEYLYPTYVNDQRIFQCAADPMCEPTGWLGYQRRWLIGRFSPPPFAVSYHDVSLALVDSTWLALIQRGETTGWLLCRQHGDRFGGHSSCYSRMYTGLHLRLGFDGSVLRRVRARTRPVYMENMWQLLTDEFAWPRDAVRRYRFPYGDTP